MAPITGSSSNAQIGGISIKPMHLQKSIRAQRVRDQVDDMLLAILQHNAELPLSEIGKQLGLTKMSISNRIRRLKNMGILEGAHFQVNPEKVGQNYLVVCQVICEVSGPNQEKIATQIARMPGVQSVYLTFGQYDILFIARRKDKNSAKELLYKVTRIPGIRNTLTTIPHTVTKESLEIAVEA